MKMKVWKWKHWGIFTACWFLGTFGVFFLREKFKDVDAVIYPSVFILIFSLLIGPGMIGLLIPLPRNEDYVRLREVSVFVSYFICYMAMRGLAHLCF